MRTTTPLCVLALSASQSSGFSFHHITRIQRTSETTLSASRREVIAIPAVLLLPAILSSPVNAEEGDLTSQMFNPDGSPKEGVETEAKERTVEFSWDFSKDLSLSEDGQNIGTTQSGKQVKLKYKYPFKWSDGKDGDVIYFDRSEGTNAKACKRVTVFQAEGDADIDRLKKASLVGVAKSIGAPKDTLERLYKADIISGKIDYRNDQAYYEWDMAAAPDSCSNSAENLGLGFCPYDNIFLLSATIVEDKLYCIVVECDSTKIWKLASSELKRVRSSFIVDAVSA
ncbi:unnamed protein product [Cylindrotheca closterium]|uniref:PsbP C-terminal domain-containing protein n=1 Tax=Cylindrotheca closterium TaxID=2856 RepID=A0AAD2JJ28_9STRA|nr:unnamed protein product [Cylindrotheca closterium]